MHQSRMLSSQWNHTFSKRSGTILMRPSRTASPAAFAMSCMLQNHCTLMRGSITAPLRWPRPSFTV